MTKFENYKRPCCMIFHIKTRKWIRNLIQYGPQTALLAGLITLLMIWLGALAQDARTVSSRDTQYLYETTRVCGIHVYNSSTTSSATESFTTTSTLTKPNEVTTTIITGNASSSLTSNITSSTLLNNVSTTSIENQELQFPGMDPSSSSSIPLITVETFDSKEDVMMHSEHLQQQQLLLEDISSNETISSTLSSSSSTTSTIGTSIVAHCGDCGACSNPHDIQIYDQTKDTLFESSFVCSKRGLFGGRRVARRCLRERVGFTDECNECWVENIMCDVRDCLFTCMWHALFSEVNSNTDPSNLDHQQTLNRCTECDEKRCGPAFVKCAGANRRRSGILSEFERDVENEFCTAVDTGWWNDKTLQSYWSRSQNLQQEEEEEQHVQLEEEHQQDLKADEDIVLDEAPSGDGDDHRSLRLRTSSLNEG